ncbi:MAG: lysophospholipid acyltransferase family protein [Bacteroidales bacterium]|jgi:1-acyl-sn-glycerol-3-phosphate acyltransferase
MKEISKFIFKILGWTYVGGLPDGISKAVMIIAPHTSNWDFMYGKLYVWIKQIPVSIIIKKEAFFWPTGGLLKKVGGIPIDRARKGNTVGQIAALFKVHDPFFLGITPEGTRKKRDEWKRGFYFIAMEAKVPLIMSYLDYGKKEAGIGPILYPTGDYEADLKVIQDFYRGKTARYPDQFNL